MNRLLLFVIAIVVVGIGAALADLPGLEANIPRRSFDDHVATTAPDRTSDRGWRRTVRGWEHESSWQHALDTRTPFQRISPLVIGALQLCTAAGALAYFDKRSPATN